MAITVIHSTTQTARKEYFDDGWEFIKEWIDEGLWGGDVIGKQKKITFAEARILVKHRNRPKPYKILPGDMYERQFNNYDGQVYTWRMNRQLYELACKYDLFPEY